MEVEERSSLTHKDSNVEKVGVGTCDTRRLILCRRPTPPPVPVGRGTCMKEYPGGVRLFRDGWGESE
jgi:hypothetical protein